MDGFHFIVFCRSFSMEERVLATLDMYGDALFGDVTEVARYVLYMYCRIGRWGVVILLVS